MRTSDFPQPHRDGDEPDVTALLVEQFGCNAREIADEPWPEGPTVTAPRDLAESVEDLSGLLRRIARAAATRDECGLWCAAWPRLAVRLDLPSVLTRRRCDASAIAPRDRAAGFERGERTPFWIGDYAEWKELTP